VGRFPITTLDALRLNHGLRQLGATDPPRAEEVRLPACRRCIVGMSTEDVEVCRVPFAPEGIEDALMRALGDSAPAETLVAYALHHPR
jgi:hypothetical protein